MINKVLTEEEMFEERLRRLDKQEYLDEKEHRFILANIKACFKEALHQREYIKQLERVMAKQQETLETLKPFLKRGLHIEKIDLTKEENEIYKGYLPKDYNKPYIYKWDYNYSVWDVFRNEENVILLKEWLENGNSK